MRLLIIVTAIMCLATNFAFATKQQPSIIKKVRVEPLEFNRTTGLEIKPVLSADMDNDQEYEFAYRWFLNGEEDVFATSASYPGESLQRGDQVSIEVTPITAEGERLQPFVSLPLTVANAPPVIISEPPDQLSSNVLTYQVEATDPDGDPLTFRVENAAEDTTIDSTSGSLLCNLEQHLEATSFSVIIVVEDDFGGRAEQRFKLDLSFVEKKGKINE